MKVISCENCKFWNPIESHNTNEQKGECRVRSPLMDFNTNQGLYERLWVITQNYDWCGEFRRND